MTTSQHVDERSIRATGTQAGPRTTPPLETAGTGPERVPDTDHGRQMHADRGRRMRALLAHLRAVRRAAARLTATRRRRAALLAVVLAQAALFVAPAVWLVHHVYFDRSGLPNLESFVRFEPPTTGVVRDAHGTVLIELAREYRRVVTYDDVPPILRQAILAAEDKSFFSHSGVDYRALPRVVQKMTARSVSEWWKGGSGFRLLLPQGGSTLTQQLVRGYFLQGMTSRVDGDAVFHAGMAPPRLFAAILGASATNKLLRKMEELRLTIWLEEEMRRRYGSQERAKREIFARYASFIYLGNGRYGYAAASEYLLWQAAVELHDRRCGDRRLAGGDQQIAAGVRASARQPAGARPPQPDTGPDGAQRVHPRQSGHAVPA